MEISKVQANSEEHTYKKNQLLYRTEDDIEYLYVILQGNSFHWIILDFIIFL